MTYKGKIDQIPVYESMEGYAKYAPLYDKDEEYLYGFDLKLFLRHVRSLKNLHILDAGCGTGRLVSFFKKRDATDVIGVDISEQMLDFAEKTGFYSQLVCLDLKDELPFQWDEFDAIFCSLVLVHFQERDIPAFLEDCLRTLKTGGKLYLINIPQRRAPLLQAHGERFFIKSYQHSDKTIYAMLEELGCREVEVYSHEEKPGEKIASLFIVTKTD